MNLSPAEARARFTHSPVARLATADAAGVPHIVPITFAIDGDTVYFAVDHKPKRTHDLRRLRNITANPHVALLTDHYADDWSTLWWTRADGHATIHPDGPTHREAVALLQRKYVPYADRPPLGPVVSIRAHTWTGWAYAD